MFLTLPEMEAEIFITLIGVNWLKVVTTIFYRRFDLY